MQPENMRSVFFVFCGEQPDRVYYRSITRAFWTEEDAHSYIQNMQDDDDESSYSIEQYSFCVTDAFDGSVYVAVMYDCALFSSDESVFGVYDTMEAATHILDTELQGERVDVRMFTPQSS